MGLVTLLDKLVADHPDVKFGSYPYVFLDVLVLAVNLFKMFG